MKFSVIIPAFNAELYLRRCVDSVIDQSFDDLEIIVINDGSTDKTLEILLDFCRDNGKVIVINKENAGVSAARNSGLKIAKGDYIVFLDADDWVDKGYFSFVNHLIELHCFDGLVLGHKNDDGKRCVTKAAFDKELTLSGETYRNMYISGVITNNPWDKIFKRKIYIENDIFFPEDIKMGEDAVVSAQLGVYSKNIYVSDKAFVHYMQDTNGVTKRKIKIEHVRDLDNALTKIIQSYRGLVDDVVLSHMYVVKMYSLVRSMEYVDFKNSPYHSCYMAHVNNVPVRKFTNKRELVKYYPLYVLSKVNMLPLYSVYNNFFVRVLKTLLFFKKKDDK